jgi:hypothetical protein
MILEQAGDKALVAAIELWNNSIYKNKAFGLFVNKKTYARHDRKTFGMY